MFLKKTYIVQVTQSGTNTPTVVQEFKNTIGNIIWSRTGVGLYELTLAGAFPVTTKTLPINFSVINTSGTPVWLLGERISDNVYQITCLDSTFTETDLQTSISFKIDQYID